MILQAIKINNEESVQKSLLNFEYNLTLITFVPLT